jgi:hypothetical protein
MYSAKRGNALGDGAGRADPEDDETEDEGEQRGATADAPTHRFRNFLTLATIPAGSRPCLA